MRLCEARPLAAYKCPASPKKADERGGGGGGGGGGGTPSLLFWTSKFLAAIVT